jgi:hypothetical protein
MGFSITKKATVAPVPAAIAALDGLVEEGYHVARCITCDESVSGAFTNSDGSPKVSFVWDVEIFNPAGTNARVRIWTGQSLHEKSYSNHLARALYHLGDTVDVGFVFDTDDCLGRPFRLLLDVTTVEVDGVSKRVNRANKPYVIKPFDGENPFPKFNAADWGAAPASVVEFDEEIPF